MPKTRFDVKPRDPLKELIFGRKTCTGVSTAALAEKVHMSRQQFRTIADKPSGEWKISTAFALASALDIPYEEVRAVIGKR